MERTPQTLSKAFDLVNPAVRGAAIAAAYGFAPTGAHWKDQISAVVTDDDLTAAGVTISDVEAAVIHYTATVPKVTREQIHGSAFVTFLAPAPGYLVVADGYRQGPAGDR